ncbi:MAG: hypothetical protein KF715_11865 [Candidatus Didemnitutus sp.]|nr:hypothetical protein [Candidatus Didemnitutus sp.]
MTRRAFIGAVFLAVFCRLTGTARAATASEVVREAIQRQRVLRLRYGGHMRLVEPHAIGITTGGHRAVLAWQIEGGSRSDPPSGWRTFLLEDVSEAALTVRGFTRRPSYNRDKAALHAIELEVTPPEDAATNPPATNRD